MVSKILDVVIQEELVRMRPQPQRVHFLGPLVVDPGLDRVLGEHIALQQEASGLLQGCRALLRASPAWTARLPVLPAPDRRCPCRAARPDRSCSRCRRVRPSAWPRRRDRGCRTDQGSAPPPALPSGSRCTSECGWTRSGFGWSTRGSPALRNPGSAACMSWWSGS